MERVSVSTKSGVPGYSGREFYAIVYIRQETIALGALALYGKHYDLA